MFNPSSFEFVTICFIHLWLLVRSIARNFYTLLTVIYTNNWYSNSMVFSLGKYKYVKT